MMDFGKVGMMTFPTASGKSLKKKHVPNHQPDGEMTLKWR